MSAGPASTPVGPAPLRVLMKMHRRRAGLTQDQLATKLHVEPETIKKYEQGRRVPPEDRLEALARVLALSGADRDELVDAWRAARSIGRPEPHQGAVANPAAPTVAQSPTNQRKRGRRPVELTAFVGRERELQEICGLLETEDVRLITLVGAGGAGKTRLALMAAHDAGVDFKDGVVTVELAALTHPHQVATEIMAGFHLQEWPDGELATVLSFLEGKHLLLVLDNFEHVLGARLDLAEILGQCPYVRVLVTSRTRLRLSGEHVFQVAPMPAPPAGGEVTAEAATEYDSVQLFVRRAREANPGFQLTRENAGAVAELCAVLEGHPLAIELAAARTARFEPKAVLARLRDVRVGHLGTLRGGPEDAPGRHQAMGACLDWSWALLSDRGREALRATAVFRGGFTVEGLAAAGGVDLMDAEEGIDELLEGSLLQGQDGIGPPRFTVHETVRQFAASKLETANLAELCRHHAGYFVRLGRDQRRQAQIDSAAGDDLMELDRENYLLAIEWLVANGRRAEAAVLAGDVRGIWSRGAFGEGRRVMAAVLPPDGNETADDLRAMVGAGLLALYQADLAAAEDVLARGLRLAGATGDGDAESDILLQLGDIARLRGQVETAFDFFDRCRRSSEGRGDDVTMANAIGSLGLLCLDEGHVGRAAEHFTAALAVHQARKDLANAATGLVNLALCSLARGSIAEAERRLAQAVDLSMASGNIHGLALAERYQALLLVERGDLKAATHVATGVLTTLRNQGDVAELASSLDICAAVAAASGDLKTSAQLARSTRAVRAELGISLEENKLLLSRYMEGVNALEEGSKGESPTAVLPLAQALDVATAWRGTNEALT